MLNMRIIIEHTSTVWSTQFTEQCQMNNQDLLIKLDDLLIDLLSVMSLFYQSFLK